MTDDVAALVVAGAIAAARHARETNVPTFKGPATVISVSGKIATVRPDDASGAFVDVACSLVTVVARDRVMIEGRPKGAAYITAKIAT